MAQKLEIREGMTVREVLRIMLVMFFTRPIEEDEDGKTNTR